MFKEKIEDFIYNILDWLEVFRDVLLSPVGVITILMSACLILNMNKSQIHAWIEQEEAEYIEAREASAVSAEIVKVYDIIDNKSTVHCILVDIDGELQEINVPYPIYEEGDVVRCYKEGSRYELLDD